MELYPEWQYKPFRLDKEGMKDPMGVVHRFFETYSLPLCRNGLWELQAAAFETIGSDGWDSVAVSEWIHLPRALEALIEAAFVLHQQALKRTEAIP